MNPAARARRLRALCASAEPAEAESARRRLEELRARHGLTAEDLEEDPEPVVVLLGPETVETPFALRVVAALSGLSPGWDPDAREPAIAAPDLPTALRWQGAYRGVVRQLRELFERAREVGRGTPEGLHPTPFGPSPLMWFGPGGYDVEGGLINALGRDPLTLPVRDGGRASYYHGLTEGALRLLLLGPRRGGGRAIVKAPRRPRAAGRRAVPRTVRVQAGDVQAAARGRAEAHLLRVGYDEGCAGPARDPRPSPFSEYARIVEEGFRRSLIWTPPGFLRESR